MPCYSSSSSSSSPPTTTTSKGDIYGVVHANERWWDDETALRPIILHVLYDIWNHLPQEDRGKLWKEKRVKWNNASTDLLDRWKIKIDPKMIKKQAGLIQNALREAEGEFDVIKYHNILAEKYPEVGLTSDMAAQYGAKILGEQATHVLSDGNKKQDILISLCKDLSYLRSIDDKLTELVNYLVQGKESRVNRAMKHLVNRKKSQLNQEEMNVDEENEKEDDDEDDDDEADDDSDDPVDENTPPNISLSSSLYQSSSSSSSSPTSNDRFRQEIEKKKKEREEKKKERPTASKKRGRQAYA